MSKAIQFSLISIVAFFLGSQVTEGCLLVPYWQSLSSIDFYTYYQNFGPKIGLYYTILTVIAAMIPIGIAIYFYKVKSSGYFFAVISSFLAIVTILMFYLYFKGANELFYQSALDNIQLENALLTWEKVHWIRVLIEALSLYFLMMAFSRHKVK